MKEGVRKDTGQKVAIKVIDKKDAVFDAESLEQEVSCNISFACVDWSHAFEADCHNEESQSSELRCSARCI